MPRSLGERLLKRLQEEGEQLPDRHHWESRRPDFPFAVNQISVATPDAGLGQVDRLREIVNDLRRRSFRDPDAFGDISQACVRVAGDAVEHVAVVCNQAPTAARIYRT